MKISKSQLRKVIKEQVSAFFVTPQPLGTVGRTKNLEMSLNNKVEDVDINEEALKDIIRQVIDDVENSSHNRMVGEVSGVDSMKPNDPHTPEDEAEKDAADDVMEAVIRKNKKVRVDSSGDEYDGKVGVIHKVGTGKQKGAYVVKMPDGSLNSYNEDELVMEAKLVPEGKKAKLTDKVLDNPSTIKLMNPSKKSETFVIFSRNTKGMRGKQDKFSMAVIDKNGMIIDDFGSHPMEQGAMKFAKARGFTKKKVAESFNTAPAGQGKEQASVIGTNEAPELGSLATNPKSKQIIKKMHDLVTKKLKLKTVESIEPIKGGVAFIFGDKAEATKMAKYLKSMGALGRVTPLVRGNRTMVSLRIPQKMGEELPLYSDYANKHKD